MMEPAEDWNRGDAADLLGVLSQKLNPDILVIQPTEN